VGWIAVVMLACLAAPLEAQQAADSLVIDITGHVTVLRSLAGLPRDTVSSTFHNGASARYTGVRLRTLLEHSGSLVTRLRGPALAQYIVVEAQDGYRVAFGVADLDTSLVAHTLLLADSVDGHALSAEDGRWRLVVAGDHGGARSPRLVSAIRVRDASPR
jgi:DMSO/TMAO reductase YedYZ molybdopterin-dependent catalytic subunit